LKGKENLRANGLHGSIVSVVVPAYNEQNSIDDILTRTRRVVEASRMSYELIVVDDGSSDRTRELALRHKAIVLWNKTNQGKGAALRKGISHACGDIVVTMDADGSHDPEDIPRLILPVLNGATLSLGTRFLTDEGRRTTKKINLVGNKLFNFSIRLLTGRRITDSQCGFRAFKRSFLEENGIVSEGFEVETELLLKALKNGYAVEEVPLNAKGRQNGHSHVNVLADGFKIMRTIVSGNFEY
jgi:glycosyltransferase involved in cell wall biosynthesis